MAGSPKEDYPDAPAVVGRRSPRIRAAIPIIIRGVDASGKVFKEDTWTIGVNRQGAKIATYHQWQVGDQITVENPVLDRAGKAHVVRVEAGHFPDDPFEIGVELNEPENIWGVKFPPENWQRSPSLTEAAPKAEGKSERTPGRESPPPVSAPELVGISSAAAEKAAERLGPAGAPGLITEPPPSATGRAEKPGEGQVAPARPAVVRSSDPTVPQKLPGDRDSGRQEEKLLRSLREQIETLSASIRASRADLEAHLARFQELQQGCQSEVAKAQDSIAQFTQKAIDSARTGTEERLRERLEGLCADSLAEVRKRLQAEATKTVETCAEQARIRLAALVEERVSSTESQLQGSLAQVRERTSEELSRQLETAVADGALTFRKQLAELSAVALEGFRHYTEALSAGLQTEFQTALSQVQASAVHEASRQLKVTVEELRQSSAQVLESQTDDVLEQAIHQLRTREEGFLEETEQRLKALARSAAEKLTQETNSWLEECRGNFRRSLQGLQAEAARELGMQLQKAADEQYAAHLKQFRRDLEDLCEQGVAAVRAKLEHATLEATNRVYKQVGMMALMTKDWEDRTKSTLDAHLREAVESFRRESVVVSQDNLEKHRQDSERLLEEVRGRFRQAISILAAPPPAAKKT